MEGETNMRKESISRLLLTMVTAFVMVAGVFGAAVTTFSVNTMDGELNQSVSQMAVGDSGMQTDGTGDAPVSVIDTNDFSTDDGEATIKSDFSLSTSNIGESEIPEGFEYVDPDYEPIYDGLVSEESEPLPEGTRALPGSGVDANGPYGELPPAAHYYEGDTVIFEASIIGGLNSDFMFRWDVNDDGQWDGPGAAPDYWGAKGETDFVMDFLDNHYGDALVQAWDGVSMMTFYESGDVWDESTAYSYYHYGGSYGTVGHRFVANREVTINQLGMFRYTYPYQYYNIRLWDANTQALLRSYSNPYVPNNAWRWFNIAPITIPAGAYVVSVGFRGYYQRGTSNPGTTADGAITSESWCRAYPYNQNNFPNQVVSDVYIPFIDFKYEFSYQLPEVFEDEAGVFVDNRAPVAINPTVIGAPAQEGGETGFTGALLDAGTEDDWMFRWHFGDGDISDWMPVPKYPIYKVCFLEALSSMATTTISALQTGLPSHAQLTVFDIEGGNPTLEFLLDFDAILVATWGYPDDWEELGDILADASDAGIGIVQCGGSFWPSPPGDMGIMGRWYDEEYNAIDYTIPTVATRYLGAFDASHPIMDGISELTSMVNHPSTTTTTYSSWVADYSDGGILLAATDDNHHGITGSGRIVAYNTYINQGSPMYASGDHIQIIANALGWVAHGAGPYSMPIPLPVVYHTYKDDDPTSITPFDTLDVKLEIKDDDHEREVGDFGDTIDWTNNIALAPQAVATHGGGGVGVWGPDRLNNGDKIGLYNDCWTTCYPPGNWNQLTWPTPVVVAASKDYWSRWRPTLSYYYALKEFDFQYWDGSSWVTLFHFDDGQPYTKVDHTVTLPSPVVTSAVRYGNMVSKRGPPYNIMIQEWEIFSCELVNSYTMQGLDDADTTVVIENVWPTAENSLPVVLDVQENTPMLFEEFKVVDPAKGAKTESFRYRWDFDDGTPRGDWLNPSAGANTEIRVLLFHSLNDVGIGSPLATQVYDAIDAVPEVVSVDQFNFYEGGSYPAIPSLQDMINNYDVCVFGSSYNLPGDTSREGFGDNLADWQDATGGGVVTMMYTYGQAGSGNEQWTLLGRYIDDDYGPYEKTPRLFGTRTLGNILNPGHPVMSGLTNLGNGDRHDGMLATTPGGEIIAEWTGGYPAIGVKENPSGRTVHISGGGYTPFQGDFNLFMANAINWVATGGLSIEPVEHNFMDNGIYDVHLEIIDDDMYWDFSGPQPVFVGPGSEEDWIGGTVFPVSVDNTDPVISPRIRAYGELDLSLRMSGEKKNSATLRLIETMPDSTVNTYEATVERDPGKPDVVVLPAIIEMTGDYSYELQVEYNPEDGDGANPTWIFEGHWPDGKIKQLKHTFNSNDPTDLLWVIGDVKPMMKGHDIIFEVVAADIGSDDLAFLYNWGDTSPHGVHIYDNDYQTVLAGVSDEASLIFNQDPDRDPWFDRAANDVRSPDGTPISIMDSISHAFDEEQSEYYYVTVTVMDDDVGDGYPSTFLNGGGYDMEFVCIDFR
jgi:hypothetical protein